MTSRERLHLTFAGQPADRIGKADAPWPHTREKWRREGLPTGVHANDFFKMDLRHMVRVDGSFMRTPQVMEQNETFVIERDANGALVKRWKDEHATPHTLEHAIRSPDDWARAREGLQPDPRRFSFGYYGDYGYEYFSAALPEVARAVAACPNLPETYLFASVLEPYEAAMRFMGDAALLLGMADEPEFIADLFTAQADFASGSVRLLLDAGVRLDGVFVGGDIAYKNGLLFSPRMYREMLFPRHRRMFRQFHEWGLQVVYHSDGNFTAALPMLIEAGADAVQPLEVQAGMDLDELASAFGNQVSFMGNVSVQALSGTQDEAVAEARRKIRAGKRTRGYVFHSDHSVPPTVSLANYRAVMEVFEEEAWR